MPGEVPDAVVVRILERAGVDLIDDSVAPRHRPRRLDESISDDHARDRPAHRSPLGRLCACASRAGPSTTSARGRTILERAYGFRPRYLALERGRFARRACCPCSARRASSRTHACGRSRCSPTAARWRTTTGLAMQLIEAARDLPATRRDRHASTPTTGASRRRTASCWRSCCRAGWCDVPERPRRAAGELAQDLEQPVPQPQEGGRGGARVSRGRRRRGPAQLPSHVRAHDEEAPVAAAQPAPAAPGAGAARRVVQALPREPRGTRRGRRRVPRVRRHGRARLQRQRRERARRCVPTTRSTGTSCSGPRRAACGR